MNGKNNEGNQKQLPTLYTYDELEMMSQAIIKQQTIKDAIEIREALDKIGNTLKSSN